MRKPCISCGTPTPATRCADCDAERLRTYSRARGRSPRSVGYDSRWDRLSKRARAAQPWCSWCGREDDLSADHKRWPARGLADVQVLCRSCNSKRGPVRPQGGKGSRDAIGTGALGISPVTHRGGAR